MKREFLKELGLEGEVIDKIMNEHGKGIEDMKVKVQDAEKVQDELKLAKEQLDKVQNDLKSFEGKDTQLEEMQNKLKASQAELETFKSETQAREHKRNVEDKYKAALSKKFAPDMIDLIVAGEDLDKLQLNEAGDIVDIESKIKRIAEQRPTAVLQVKNNSDEPRPGDPPNDDDDAQLRKAMGLKAR